MSSCISGGRGFGFELDIAKPSSPSSGGSSSPPSSALSESSNSPRGISIKRARAPRKRPKQTYNEAAALLSAIYPTVFSAKSLTKLSKEATLAAFPESPDLLPPFPVLGNAAFLIHQPPPENRPADTAPELKHEIPADRECASPVSTVSWDPSPPTTDPFDAESILDEEVGGGIDNILGTRAYTSVADNDESNHSHPSINPLLRSLIGQKMGVRFELGLGFARNLQRALRNRDGGDWWRNPTTVPVRDINPDFKPTQPPRPAPKKKKKKETGEKEAENAPNSANSAPTPSLEKVKAGLGLKLSHEEVLTAWSGRCSMFSDGPDCRNSSTDALLELADIDLSPDAGGGGAAAASGVREASVLTYKEKRRTRLFSRTIRYQVRKTNADRRPRMKVCEEIIIAATRAGNRA